MCFVILLNPKRSLDFSYVTYIKCYFVFLLCTDLNMYILQMKQMPFKIDCKADFFLLNWSVF